MDKLNKPKFWIVAGTTMLLGVAGAFGLGAPALTALVVGAGGPLLGAFAQVLAGD